MARCYRVRGTAGPVPSGFVCRHRHAKCCDKGGKK